MGEEDSGVSRSFAQEHPGWGMRAGAPLFKRPAWEMAAEAWVLAESPVQPHCRQEKRKEEKGGRERRGGSSSG